MPLFKITTKLRKDGREVSRFRDSQGIVTTRGQFQNFTRMEQMRDLGDYGIQLQLQQVAAGSGSDGQPMRSLRPKYAAWKAKIGLKPVRDLRGPGGRVLITNKKRRTSKSSAPGHMLEAIRQNYLSDKEVRLGITTQKDRIKASANEAKSPWWGWNPASVRKLADRMASVFQTGTAEYLMTMGLIGANALNEAKRMWRKVS